MTAPTQSRPASTTPTTATPATSATSGRPTDLDELLARRRPGWSLEAPFYVSEEAYRRDLDAVFSRRWVFVAAAAEVPEPGDYVTVDIGDASVLVVRDDEEVVRAFRNVCRHRGSRLLEGRGETGNIVCPYHRWTYGTDGSLLFAEAQPPDFDKACFSLRSVHVRVVGGLVLVCLAADPPDDLDEVTPLLEPLLAPYDLGAAKVAATVDVQEAGNWKLVVENNRECYHCDGHPELISAYFPLFAYEPEDITPRLRPMYERFTAAETALAQVRARHGLPPIDERQPTPLVGQLTHVPLDGEGRSFAPGGGAVCRRLLGSVQDAAFGDLSLHLQPSCWFHVTSDHAVVFSVLPTSATTSVLRTTWLVHADAVEGVDYDVDALTAVWRATNDQDRELVERTQRGCADPGYEPGPYSMVEDDVEAFVAWYVERLRESAP